MAGLRERGKGGRDDATARVADAVAPDREMRWR
jgi:hypothetical protein